MLTSLRTITIRGLLAVAVSAMAIACGAAAQSDVGAPEPASTAGGDETGPIVDEIESTTSSTLLGPTTPAPPKETGSITLGPKERPAELVAPAIVGGPAPLLVVLHGFGSSPEEVDSYLSATDQASERGLYIMLPTGTIEKGSGRRFWDANAACCNSTDAPVDDVGYLRNLIEEALAERPIDPERVYMMGYSNGGFMTYRMACDASDLLAAVVVVSGADAPTVEECTASGPVSVLHVHGDADEAVKYAGGSFGVRFPGAEESVARWAERNGCEDSPTVSSPIDLDQELTGLDTGVEVYRCPEGVEVQLDTIRDGVHLQAFIPDQVGRELLDWLLDH